MHCIAQPTSTATAAQAGSDNCEYGQNGSNGEGKAVVSTLSHPYQSNGPMYTMNQIGSHDATRKYQ